jgi:ribonuclease P protein component
MIVLQCSHCGHEIQVSDSLRDREIRCARCGTPLSAKPEADAAAAATSVRPGNAPGVPAGSQAVTHDTGNQDTLTPRPVKGEISLSFLSAASRPGELGWLAHYRIVRMLGHGGMGIVFEAVDTQLDRHVALKVLKPEFTADQDAQERFLREARAMAAVKSDHIVTVHQVGQKHHTPFLAMELLEGESLEDWLRRRGRPTVAEALRLGIQIGRGLAAAHQRGLIHRDIKPGNIFLECPGGAPSSDICRVKVLDFGLARIVHNRSHVTEPGVIMGTPGYMAPEQLDGKEVDARCDLFNLGALLYEMTTGRTPFSGDNPMAAMFAALTKVPKPPRELNPELPPALADLIARLLAKEPRDRPASANEVVDNLEAVMRALGGTNALPETQRGTGTIEPPVGAGTRRAKFVFILIVLTVLLAGPLGVALVWLLAH